MSKQAKGEPRTSSVVVENTLQKVSMEMSKLVEDLEDNVNILNGQKQQANATNNNNNAANANKKPNATISNKNKNSANNKKAGSASSNNTSNAPQNRNRVLANRNKKNSYSSNRNVYRSDRRQSSFVEKYLLSQSYRLPMKIRPFLNVVMSAKSDLKMHKNHSPMIWAKSASNSEISQNTNRGNTLNESVYLSGQMTSDNDKSNSDNDKLTSGNDKLTSDNDKLTSDNDKSISDNDKLTSGSNKLTSDNDKSTSDNVNTNSDNVNQKFDKVMSDSDHVKPSSDNVKSNSYNVKSNPYNVKSNSYNVNSNSYNVKSNSYNVKSKSYNVKSKSQNVKSNSYNVKSKSHNLKSNSNNVKSNFAKNMARNFNIKRNNINNKGFITKNNNGSTSSKKEAKKTIRLDKLLNRKLVRVNNQLIHLEPSNEFWEKLGGAHLMVKPYEINHPMTISRTFFVNMNTVPGDEESPFMVKITKDSAKTPLGVKQLLKNKRRQLRAEARKQENAQKQEKARKQLNDNSKKQENDDDNEITSKTSSKGSEHFHPKGNFSNPIRKPLKIEETLSSLRRFVEKAKCNNKTFSINSNFYFMFQRLFRERGWVEKLLPISERHPNFKFIRPLMDKSNEELVKMLKDKVLGNHARNLILSRFLETHQVDFLWARGCDAFKYNPDSVKLTMINTIKRGSFSYSTKQGLCESMKRSPWLQEEGFEEVRHPRSYSLSIAGEQTDFTKDFKLTAAISVFKWVLHTYTEKSPVVSEEGKIPLNVFHFAISECMKFMKRCRHEDIDLVIKEASFAEWERFLQNYYRIVHIDHHFKSGHLESEDTLVHKSKLMLVQLSHFVNSLDVDGFMNIWILKPVCSSMGIGIHICRTLHYLFKILADHSKRSYVVQKYLERPLLIYNTKFDIRQWFLISSTVPLTIWMYKVCYLRFSSQTYNLRKLHESIHLTNNSVQTRYKNCNRDPNLPQHNMWDSVEFQKYLENSGYPNAWKNIIYPGMRQCFVAAVLLNQEYICARKNSFELYGADFMITEDFKPWLIEINSRPALHPSTPVTARLCPQVLEDVIKVVIDNARDANAKTGQFEQIYKQKIPPLPKCNVDELKLEGTPLPSSYFCKPEEVKDLEPKINPSSGLIDINNTNSYMKYVRNEMRKTLEKLLTIIRTERSRRKKLKNLNSNASNTKAIKQQEIDKCNKNIDKGVECVLEIKDLMKHQEKSKDQLVGTDNVEKSNSSIQVDLIKELIGEDGSQEAEAIKDTLLKITETSDSTSSTAIFNDVLKLLSGLKKEEN